MTLFQVFKSVISAMFGVQKKETLIRDFENGKASQFIFVGLVMVAIFLFVVISVVMWVIPSS